MESTAVAATCPYCLTPAAGETSTCPHCGAVHHSDCYAESGACAVLGCSGSRDRQEPAAGATPIDRPAPVASTLAPAPAPVAPASPPRPTAAPALQGMDTRTWPCATCGRQVAIRLIKCPGCGSAAPWPPPPPASQPASPQQPAPQQQPVAGRIRIPGRSSATIYEGALVVAAPDGTVYEFRI